MDNNNTILLAKIRDVLSALFGTFTSDLAIIKAKLEGISDLIIRNAISTDTDTIEFNTDLTEKLCKCDISFSYIQAGSGTPAPDNVRNISGYDTLNVAVLESHDPEGYLLKEIEFDETVYVGNIDVISGKGEITHKLFTFTGSETWAFNSSNNFFYTTINSWRDAKAQTDLLTNNGIKFRVVQGSQYSNIIRVYIADNSDYIDSSTDMTTIMTNTTHFIYELLTPAQINTTPEAITTIEDDNLISTNTSYTHEDPANVTGIEVCYFETVNSYFKNKEV